MEKNYQKRSALDKDIFGSLDSPLEIEPKFQSGARTFKNPLLTET